MKKLSVINALFILGVVSFLMLGWVANLNAAAPPDKVTIAVIKDKKPAVEFKHKAHEAKLAGKCGNCHVKADGTGGLKDEVKQKPADMAAAMKNPFHTECLNCHKAAGKPEAPTRCDGCHK